MPKCTRCGTDNPADVKFCRQCGLTLSAPSTGVDIAEVLASAQRGREAAERRVPELESELAARGKELADALAQRAALEHELAATKADRAQDAGNALLASATAKIQELERRLATGMPSTTAAAAGRRRWLAPVLGVALLAVGGGAAVDHWRGLTARADADRVAQRLQAEVAAARQRETELRDRITALGRGASAGAAGAKAAESALTARRAEIEKAEAVVVKRAADLDAAVRRLADDRRIFEASRKESRNAAARRSDPAARDGFLIWQGRVERPTGVYLTGGQANTGEVTGTLPGRRCDIRIERIGARVTTEPGPKNNWNQAAIAPEPGRLATVVFAWSCP